MVQQLVTPEARTHGDYVAQNVSVTEGEFDGATKGKMRVVMNRGGSTVERWISRGDLSRGQSEAIALYSRLWRLWIGEQRVTANWSLVATFRSGAASIDDFASTRIRAKAMLDHLDNAVFFAFPLAHFEVWRNVVLFDEPAGVAGGRLGYRNKGAEASAKAIVLFIADMIAIDQRLG